MKKPGWLRIVDLDRAEHGLLQVSQQPMFDLQHQLKPRSERHVEFETKQILCLSRFN